MRVRSHGHSCAPNCWFYCNLTLQLLVVPNMRLQVSTDTKRGASLTKIHFFWFTAVTVQVQAQAQVQPFKARITFELNETNLLQPSGYYMYRQFNIQQYYVLPTQCIYVFCVDLRTSSDYFPIQH